MSSLGYDPVLAWDSWAKSLQCVLCCNWSDSQASMGDVPAYSSNRQPVAILYHALMPFPILVPI